MTHAPYLGLYLSAPSNSLAPAPIGADNIHARITPKHAPNLGFYLSAPSNSLAPAPIGADNIHARITPKHAPNLGFYLSAPSNSLAPAPIAADNIHARTTPKHGFGGQATTPRQSSSWFSSWVLSCKINDLTPSTTPRQRKSPSRVCACVRARLCACAVSWCRGVVSLSNSLKRKKESQHNGHDNSKTNCRGPFNPLKNNKKGGFVHG